MPVQAALLAELYLPEICQGPIRDCGRMTSNREVIHLREKRTICWSGPSSCRVELPHRLLNNVELHFVPATSPMELAGATGLESTTSCVTGRRFNQLNYARRVPDRAH